MVGVEQHRRASVAGRARGDDRRLTELLAAGHRQLDRPRRSRRRRVRERVRRSSRRSRGGARSRSRPTRPTGCARVRRGRDRRRQPGLNGFAERLGVRGCGGFGRRDTRSHVGYLRQSTTARTLWRKPLKLTPAPRPKPTEPPRRRPARAAPRLRARSRRPRASAPWCPPIASRRREPRATRSPPLASGRGSAWRPARRSTCRLATRGRRSASCATTSTRASASARSCCRSCCSSSSATSSRELASYLLLAVWVVFIAVAIDCVILGFLVTTQARREVRRMDRVERGVRWYAAMRAIQLRVDPAAEAAGQAVPVPEAKRRSSRLICRAQSGPR